MSRLIPILVDFPGQAPYTAAMTTILNKRLLPLALTLVTAATVAGCGTSAPAGGGGRIRVVAAENFWGSIAGRIGGSHAAVLTIITNPDTDPHAYEPTPQDGREMAEARYVIVNGAGYDPWAQKLLDANPSAGRVVLSIADLAGRREGDNPHMWYSPAIVHRVVDRISGDLGKLDASDASDINTQAATFRTAGLRRYDDLRSSIRTRFTGVPVGATESIFVDLARDLGLNLITPPEYMRAISEGTDPTARDRSTFDAQIGRRQITVLVFNRQNSTGDIQTLVGRARAESIPVVAITETLDPATATFQDWQAGQLDDLQGALARATGR